MRRSLLTFAIIAVTAIGWGFTATSAQAQATRTWVSGVGDDANPCSRTAPCKTFAGAISKTAPGGEIDCLDPGGFGALTITKSITIDCQGIGSVLVAGTNGIVVQAGATDKVILHGVRFDGLRGAGNANAGLSAIRFISGAQLSVDSCFIVGFNNQGIDIALTAAGEAYVTNTYITNVTNGISAATTSGTVTVAVDNTTIANPSTNGFQVTGGTVIASISNSLIASAATAGVLTSAGQVNVSSSNVVNNTQAFNATASTIRVSSNNVFNNGTNFVIAPGATISSNGKNNITADASAPNGAAVGQQ